MFDKNEKLLLVSCYKAPGSQMSQFAWVRFFSQFHGRFLVIGDFNAHHAAWGDRQGCNAGWNIVEATEGLTTEG